MKTTLLILFIVMFPLLSCDQAIEPVQLPEPDLPLEERLDVIYDEAGTDYEVYHFVGNGDHVHLAWLLEEKGYQVRLEEAVHFIGIDKATGNEGHMTLIPCRRPGDDSRVAMIQYFRGNGRYGATAAEYYAEEGYEIPHPVNEAVLLPYTDGQDRTKLELLERSEKSKRYWSCVANRFISGCAGCATVCYLTGPFWGPCTAKCCTGSAVVALISCAFTVYLGW